MPTGYTCKIEDGSITKFSEFMINCLPAFGAFINERDNNNFDILNIDLNSYNGYKVKDSYAKERITESIAEMDRLSSLTQEEIENEVFTLNTEIKDDYEKRLLEWCRIDALYDRFIKESYEFFVVVDKELKGYIEFIQSQLRTSRECNYKPMEPKFYDVSDYYETKISELTCDIDYYSKSIGKSNATNTSRKDWIQKAITLIKTVKDNENE